MDQQRLFVLAPESYTVTAYFTGRQGWCATVRMRRQGEAWQDSYRADYSDLSTSELADVLSCELETLFGKISDANGGVA